LSYLQYADHFPLDALAGGVDWPDGGVGEDGGELAGECAARGQVPAVGDDLLADDPQPGEGGPLAVAL
jgi:hypothetical protein